MVELQKSTLDKIASEFHSNKERKAAIIIDSSSLSDMGACVRCYLQNGVSQCYSRIYTLSYYQPRIHVKDRDEGFLRIAEIVALESFFYTQNNRR